MGHRLKLMDKTSSKTYGDELVMYIVDSNWLLQ